MSILYILSMPIYVSTCVLGISIYVSTYALGKQEWRSRNAD